MSALASLGVRTKCKAGFNREHAHPCLEETPERQCAAARGGPKRGIGLLEVGKLEGPLEASLRDPRTRERTIKYIAQRVVYALQRGIATPGSTTATGPSPGLPPQQPPAIAGP